MHELAESYNRAHNALVEKKRDSLFNSQAVLLRQWINENARISYIPTVSAALVKDEEVVFFHRCRSEVQKKYSIASFTKTFTALAALQLVDRRKVRLDEPVNNYFPLFLENDNLSTRQVTLRDLLTHTAGVVNLGTGEDGLPRQLYPAGSRFYYSNQGFNVVGKIIEKISGQTLGGYITQNILLPLEMNNTSAPDTMKASGGMYASVEDLTRYVAMLINRGTYRDRVIVSEKVFNEIFRETLPSPKAEFDEYRGISWRIWSVKGRPYSMNHAALWNGSGGWIQVFPTLGAGFVFLSDPPVYDVDGFYRFYRGLKGEFLRITALISDKDMAPTAFHPSVPKDVELWDFTGTYRNSEKNREIKITMSPTGHLVARWGGSEGQYDIYPTSMLTFVYIFPEQTEKGLAFDFTWRNGTIVGLGVVDGYYDKVPQKGRGNSYYQAPEGL